MNKNMSSIYAVATMDTKSDEILFIADCIRAAGASVKIIDVGTKSDDHAQADFSSAIIAAHHPEGSDAVLGQTDRGAAIQTMSDALTAFIKKEASAGNIAGIIGIGGGGGTSLITRAMRALAIGLPKVMVSTLASGNVAPYVDCSDITMMNAVVDVAGINKLSSQILSNAAHAIAGMAINRKFHTQQSNKRTVAMTMFGVTTTCVDAVRKQLETAGNDCLVFHATGTGGRTMEKLIAEGFIDAVLDITTTEIADQVVGGTLSAGPKRLDIIIEKQLPYVISLGALDMVNFGPKQTVPDKFRERLFYIHNSEVTLMRTTANECRQIARWIATKVNKAKAPITILIPEKGISMIDKEGEVFHDPEADKALFEELESLINQDDIRQIIRLPFNINDQAFSAAIIEAYNKLLKHSCRASACRAPTII